MSRTRRKPTEAEVRMRRFKAALSFRGLGMGEWATLNGVGYTHLYHVVTGRHKSAVLMEKVQRFIDEVLAEHATPEKVA